MRSVVLCFSGLDPSGGAGLQADIEAIGALGSHAAVVCTALTVQDSQRVYGFQSVDAELIQQQALKVLADLPVKAIKCGMLGTPDIIAVVDNICQQYPDIPLILDPVLVANSGGSLTVDGFIEHLTVLFPRTHVLTPNSIEAESLTGLSVAETESGVIQRLSEMGAKQVLLKGGHEQGEMLRNRFYQDNTLIQTSHWPRLAGEFHGSGCSLAAGIAAGIAQGHSPSIAISRAEVWLNNCLLRADRPHADGQAIPKRFKSFGA
ncbi:hydroxymethylpyrimidine/phosphomethylpyrimidine kinase [Agitococcus lubricus]|uniref:hydroxymethylpyrimidine kinase n=1 Tax=Agitococcus lubricus TaxID=1077255 RepID=A0A2T5IWU5_9GAMM|nr:hydroxymethylpyrimidine/phosphomethylpyrimidine kinase [Agitococcus lubricus]PTQ88398.1 hydroxymethylpyrimidine/phosphomethylpyrimidine kinase [Agitococcus lubricus]